MDIYLTEVMKEKFGVDLKVRDNDELIVQTLEMQADKLAARELSARDKVATKVPIDQTESMRRFYNKGNKVD